MGFSLEMPTIIPVRLGARSYPILIGSRILPDILCRHPLLRKPDVRVFLIADRRLAKIAVSIRRSLGKRCLATVFLEGGERNKHIRILDRLYAAAAGVRLDRRSVVVATGGGVVGDVAGFFAATYLRGIRIVHVPTTLVAQVDSAIGGKTGVDLPVGKNLVGAFHQPSLVVADTAALRTLTEREYRAGLAEVIKYGAIADRHLFMLLERRMDRILRRDPAILAEIVRRCCAIKARVVSRDERETLGLRAMLNFGHTIGHGVETAAGYRLRHGEAVALGMVGAARLSHEHLGLSPACVRRLTDVIQKAGLPTQMPTSCPVDKVFAAMRLDKKALQGEIRFVLLTQIGQVKTGIAIPREMILQTLCQLTGC
jgi:3-dehydroquinate synthase